MTVFTDDFDDDDDEDVGMSEGWSKVNTSNTELFVGCGMSQKLWRGLDLSDYPISKGDVVKVESFGGTRKLYINGVHTAIKEDEHEITYNDQLNQCADLDLDEAPPLRLTAVVGTFDIGDVITSGNDGCIGTIRKIETEALEDEYADIKMFLGVFAVIIIWIFISAYIIVKG